MGTAFVVLLLALIVLISAAFVCWVLLLAHYPDVVRADEVHRITTKDGWSLRLLRQKPAGGKGEPVLLCPGAGSNHVAFDAPAKASLVDVLTERGFDCWILEYRVCRSAVAPPGRSKSDCAMDDLLMHDIPAAIHFIRERTGYGRVHWVGHSMGGMLLYAYELTFGNDLIASGATIGSPTGFKGVEMKSTAVIRFFIRISRTIVEAKMRALVPLFRAFKWNHHAFPLDWENLHPGVDTAILFNNFEIPSSHMVDQLAEWAETQTWHMRGGALDVAGSLSKLRTPLLALFGAADPFTPAEHAKAFVDALPTPDKRLLLLSKEAGHAADYSHLDLVFGAKAREDVFEPIADWLKAHHIRQHYAAEKPEPEPKPVVAASQATAEAEPATSVEARATEPEPVAATSPADDTPSGAREATPTKVAAEGAPVKKASSRKASATKNVAAPKKASAAKKATAPKKERTAEAEPPAPAKKAAAPKKPVAKKAATPKKPVAKKPAAPKATAAKKSVAAKKTGAAPRAKTLADAEAQAAAEKASKAKPKAKAAPRKKATTE